ncbi:alpha-N-acetylgalactosaminide alpha-2,6-sialyltransferase 2 isoform X2 [Tiliqua scincoides]|uniref:alpha-N-acetylgalactosaminide alpha-2,6-sialyltransferase 2 isoform X2 n=1 Tax=Tiliqua scincoides TaxID=71010 RepID=UPI0034629967
MGSPRWKRLCLLFLAGLAASLVFYGRHYASPGSPSTASRMPQQGEVGLVQAEISQDARGHHLTGERSSLCPWSLKSKVKIEPTFGQQFNFDIPVLIWERHFTPDSWDRLKQRNAPNGWHGLPYSVISSTLKVLNDSANSRLFSTASFPNGCIRCAVVGNGGILNGSRQGKEIDAHDFVFRVNGAVTKGFEKDVGTKTSFFGFTVNTMKNSLIAYAEYGFTQIPQAKDLQYIFIPSHVRDYIMLRAAVLGIAVPEGYDEGDEPQKYFGSEASAGKFKLLHPEFMYYLRERFLRSENIKSQFGHLYMPSTGAIMLLTALHTCDQVSAYGFITENYKKFSAHYYEHEKKPLVFYANHDMLLELELWKNLHQAGFMKLYQR